MFARRGDRLVSWNHIHVDANTLVEMVHRLGGCVLLAAKNQAITATVSATTTAVLARGNAMGVPYGSRSAAPV